VKELVTKAFASQALAFPARVDQALAEIDTVEGAKDLLDKAGTMQHYAERLKAGVAIERPIAYGVLKIKAKLGQLLTREKGGRGKTSTSNGVSFDPKTITVYRKIGDHEDKIDECYHGQPNEVPSQAEVIRLITSEKRAAKDTERAEKERAANKRIKKAKTIQQALAAATFATIVVDPPWDWGDEGDVSQFGRGKTTYGAMSHEQLLAFPLGQYAATDSHLYLWITNRSLPKGFSLIEAWGYRYVTCLTWCKPSIGMGNYFRGSTEHLLFGVRGSLPLKRKDVGTWFAAPRGKQHSEKPTALYELIESCSPGPYLDIFSRRERDDWLCWGGELS